MKTNILFTLYFISTLTTQANMIETLKDLIQKKDTAQIIELIVVDPDVLDAQDENGSSGFMLLTYSGIPSAFEKAIALKKSFSFHESIVAGKIDLVGEQLAADPSLINAYANDGFTPVALASFFNQDAIANLLLEKGADPNMQAKNPSKVNALHAAVAKENYKLCKSLFQYGADVNAPQMQNVTALHSATHRGNLELVKLLVENGGDINLKMDNGDTALTIAEREGHQEVKTYLAGQ